ncbi:uncharacterized protein BXZ73DRAFT_13479, partial [Epithele typhae]|uniref:uncharacterized protein n=1 Tax=Epithele typhae TaxID=378194 RepID=UPI002008534D
VNQTIDDQLGDSVTGTVPTYDPITIEGSSCSSCSVNRGGIDKSQIFKGTWHDSSNRPAGQSLTITAHFTGTAVYAFHIIPVNIVGVPLVTSLEFFLDGAQVGTYVNQPSSSAPSHFLYQVPVFSKSGLSNTAHKFQIVSSTDNTVTLFDYIVYT